MFPGAWDKTNVLYLTIIGHNRAAAPDAARRASGWKIEQVRPQRGRRNGTACARGMSAAR